MKTTILQHVNKVQKYMNNLDINNMIIPTVIQHTAGGDRAFDIYSRLLKNRSIFLTGVINNFVANNIIAQLLFLHDENPDKDIKLFINSPGGSVSAGLAIFDTINYITPMVATYCVGEASSMGAFLLASGEKGKRYAFPNATIMIHQPLAGFSGQASDITIHANEVNRIKKKLNNILSNKTGKTIKNIEKDTDRDNFMSADEALQYGLIDKIITKVERNGY